MRISDWSSDVCSSDLGLTRVYRPALDWVLARPKTTLAIALVVLLSTVWPMSRIGSEFIPAMNEGTLLYMPSALPGISVDEASKLLQRTDRLIKTVPDVATVFGKAGRADTPPDPRPEDRRGGTECVSTCRSRWSRSH